MNAPFKLDALGVPDHQRKEYLDNAQDWLGKRLDENYFTEDAPELLKQKYQDIFVYGTLKSKFSRHDVIPDGSKFLGHAFTKYNHYIMYRTRGAQSYPVVMHSGMTTHQAHIYGEVWRVPTQTMFELDYIENNGEMYYRTTIPIRFGLMSQAHRPEALLWAYLGMRTYFDEYIEDMHLCDVLNPNANADVRYYNFMRKYEK